MSYLYQLNPSELKEFQKINHEIAIKVESYTTKDFISSSFSIDQQPIEKKIESSPIFQFNFISNKEITSFEINLLKANLFKLISLSSSSLKNIYIVPAKKDDFTSCTDVYESLDKKILSKKWKFRIFSSFQWDEVNQILEKKMDTIGLDLKNNFHFSNIRLKFDKYKGSFEVPLSSGYKINASFILLLIAQVPFDFFKYNSLDSRINQIIQEIIKTSKLKNNYIFQGLYEIKEDEVDVLKKKEFEKKIEIEQDEFIQKKKEKELLTKENKELEDKKKKIEEKQILLLKTTSTPTPVSEAKKINLENEIKKREEELEKEKAQIEKDREKRIEEEKKTIEKKQVELVNIQEKRNQVEKKLSTSSGVSVGEIITPTPRYTPLKSVPQSEEPLSVAFHETTKPSVSSIITTTRPLLPKRPPPIKPTIPAAPPTTLTAVVPKSTKTEEMAVEPKKKEEEEEHIPAITKTLEHWLADLPQEWSFEPKSDPYRNALMRYNSLVQWLKSTIDPYEFDFEIDPDLLKDLEKQEKLIEKEEYFLWSKDVSKNLKENYILEKYKVYATSIGKEELFVNNINYPNMPYSTKIKLLQLFQLFFTLQKIMPSLPQTEQDTLFAIEKRIFGKNQKFDVKNEDWKIVEEDILTHMHELKRLVEKITPILPISQETKEIEEEIKGRLTPKTFIKTLSFFNKMHYGKTEAQLYGLKQLDIDTKDIHPLYIRPNDRIEIDNIEWKFLEREDVEDTKKWQYIQMRNSSQYYSFSYFFTRYIKRQKRQNEIKEIQANKAFEMFKKVDDLIDTDFTPLQRLKLNHILETWYYNFWGARNYQNMESYTDIATKKINLLKSDIDTGMLAKTEETIAKSESTKTETTKEPTSPVISAIQKPEESTKAGAVPITLTVPPSQMSTAPPEKSEERKKRSVGEWKKDLPSNYEDPIENAKMQKNSLDIFNEKTSLIPDDQLQDMKIRKDLDFKEKYYLELAENISDEQKQDYVVNKYLSYVILEGTNAMNFFAPYIKDKDLPYSTKIRVLQLLQFFWNNMIKKETKEEQRDDDLADLKYLWEINFEKLKMEKDWEKLNALTRNIHTQMERIIKNMYIKRTLKEWEEDLPRALSTEYVYARMRYDALMSSSFKDIPILTKEEDKKLEEDKNFQNELDLKEKQFLADPNRKEKEKENYILRQYFSEAKRRDIDELQFWLDEIMPYSTKIKVLSLTYLFYVTMHTWSNNLLSHDINAQQHEKLMKLYADYWTPESLRFLRNYEWDKLDDLATDTLKKLKEIFGPQLLLPEKKQIRTETETKKDPIKIKTEKSTNAQSVPTMQSKLETSETTTTSEKKEEKNIEITSKRSIQDWKKDLPINYQDPIENAKMQKNSLHIFNENTSKIPDEALENINIRKELEFKEKYYLEDAETISDEQKENYVVDKYASYAFLEGDDAIELLSPYIKNKELPYATKIIVLQFLQFYWENVTKEEIQQAKKDQDLAELFHLWEVSFKKANSEKAWKNLEKMTQNIVKEMKIITKESEIKRSLQEWEQDVPRGTTNKWIIATMRYNALLASSFEDFPTITQETNQKLMEDETQKELSLKEKQFLGDSNRSAKEKQNYILREYLSEAKRVENEKMKFFIFAIIPYSIKIKILQLFHLFDISMFTWRNSMMGGIHIMTVEQRQEVRILYTNWKTELDTYMWPQEWENLETFLRDTMDKMKKIFMT